jgi:glycosyltransferase involved in cell wall biosynthesis
MTHVLIVSGDVVSSNMGGVGVRNWELAHALAGSCRVTLAIPNPLDMQSTRVELASYDLQQGDLRPLLLDGVDVIITHGAVLHFHPYLRETGLPMAVDLYVPNLLESLVWHARDPLEDFQPAYEEYLRLQLDLLRAGDFFFCASERQRDYWLGWLHAQKRINPHTYRQEPALRSLIDVVPFGLPAGEPQHARPVLKGVHPGIGPGDQLILWSGGLWDWLDPLTLIRAMALLAPRHPQLKLYFMGTHHPNPVVAGMEMPERAIALSRELGLLEQCIFFGDWVPYHERESYLVEADLAVISHPDHIETRFSFRTRVLDCIWAGLPLVATDGDAMADWVKSEKLGSVVPVGDAQAMAEAVQSILAQGGRKAYQHSFDNLRSRLRWEVAALPLVRFCERPALAPDKGHYLTEAERVSQAKDAFLQQVVEDKDAFMEQVIRDKDAFLEQVVHDKGVFMDQIVADKDAQIKHYQSLLPVRVYQRLKRLLGKS